MIQKIKTVKKFRSLLDFSATDVVLRKKWVIFAQNGIGKTNLSRLLNCIAQKQEMDSFISQEANPGEKIEFELELSDNSIINQENYRFVKIDNIIVFNSDYVERNVRIVNFSDKVIDGEIQLPIGENDIEIARLESDLKAQEVTREEVYDSLLKKISDTEIDIKTNNSNIYSWADRSIWEEFKLNNILDNNYKICEPHNNDFFETCETDFISISSLDENHILKKLNSEIDVKWVNFDDIYALLKKKVSFQSFDPKIKKKIEDITTDWLKSSDLLKSWVIKSRENKVCLLCDRHIDSSVDELFKKFEEYFANEEAIYNSKIDSYVSGLTLLGDSIKNITSESKSEIEIYIKLFNIEKKWLPLEDKTVLDSIDIILGLLWDKKSQPFQEYPYTWSALTDLIWELNQNIRTNNDLIDLLNKKISDTGVRKTELRKTIWKKFLYNFYISNKFKFDSLVTYSLSLSSIKIDLEAKKELLPKKKIADNIIKFFNLFLNDYLWLYKYKAELINEKFILLLNENNISENTWKISEWEKTMIWLCYFLASSIQQFSTLDKYKNAIFIIDDPICSTSYWYFFGICNLLKFFDQRIIEDLWQIKKEHVESNYNIQKLIFTHNTQFFNILRTHIYKQAAQYLFLNVTGFEEIPNGRLVSEFEIALSNIKRASLLTDFNWNIWNDLRRFFETIRHFYWYKSDFTSDTLKAIFPEFDEHSNDIFFSVVNYYSHWNPEAFTDPLPMNFTPFVQQFSKLISSSQFSELWNRI